jgi:hypothetical protein
MDSDSLLSKNVETWERFRGVAYAPCSVSKFSIAEMNALRLGSPPK